MPDINKIVDKYMEPVNEGLAADIIADIKDQWKEKKRDITSWLTKDNTKSQLEAKIKTWEEYIQAQKKDGGPKATQNIAGANDVLRILKGHLRRFPAEEKKSEKDEKVDAHKKRVENSKLSKAIKAHRETKEKK